MKKLYACAYAITLLCFYTTSAQVNPPLNQHVADKPLLFSSLPEKLECNLEEVDRLFMSSHSEKLQIRLNNQLQLEGIVTEKVYKSQEVLTVNFRISNYSDALFTISRIIQNGTIRYSGRITTRDNGDVLMLVKECEKYYFNKLSQRFVMVE
jgi:hypothetical protein